MSAKTKGRVKPTHPLAANNAGHLPLPGNVRPREKWHHISQLDRMRDFSRKLSSHGRISCPLSRCADRFPQNLKDRLTLHLTSSLRPFYPFCHFARIFSAVCCDNELISFIFSSALFVHKPPWLQFLCTESSAKTLVFSMQIHKVHSISLLIRMQKNM